MKKFKIGSLLIMLVVTAGYYYVFLPPIHLSSIEFYSWIIFPLAIYALTEYLSSVAYKVSHKENLAKKKFKFASTIVVGSIVVVALMLLVELIASPVFNARSYHERILVVDSSFNEDVKEADFSRLALLDKDSSQKLGDRVLGQLPELISQFDVSDEYTQINYNHSIVRVTPLEYSGLIKYFGNRGEGVPGYILVNSTTGISELVKLEKGMRYMPSAYLQEDLLRHVRFRYPFKILGEISFEVDEQGKPFWIIQTISYSGIGLRKEISGVIVVDPVYGDTSYYRNDDVPNWIDNVWDAQTITEQLNSWGKFEDGFINSFFGQKGVKQTTEGYNYLTQDDDVFMYTGITSAAADESNIGFVLVNLRTKEARYYAVPGAEEYSAMDSARGQVQEKKYDATFPLLINLNGKATYMLSLKDAAGLVKMYAFVDVQDYQKVTVTESSKGIEAAAREYLREYANLDMIDLTKEETKTIVVQSLNYLVIDGTTYAYFEDEVGDWYRASVKVSDGFAFIQNGDQITINFVSVHNINEVTQLK